MRIAYVCADHGIPVRGDKGASVHLRSLAEALVLRGHDLRLVARNTEGANPDPAGVVIAELPWPVARHRPFLEDLFSDWRPDAVLERYSLASGAALEAARALGVRYVLEVNSPLADEAARFRSLLEADSARARERRLIAAAEGVIAVSAAVRDHAIASGAAPTAVTVVHNGVDGDAFAPAADAGLRDSLGLRDAFVVGFTGSIRPWHGVSVLLRALQQLPGHYHALVVGGGQERHLLKELAACMGLDGRCTFTGAVSHCDVPRYLHAMDVGVAPYLPMDGFYFSPLKIAEYMAAGLPVIASRIGEIPDLIGDAGVLIEAGSEGDLARALRRLGADRGLRLSLSSAGVQRATAMSWAAVAGRVEAVLHQEASV
jgi:glycosyltransferase involved in cell wall biosynthesis